MTQLKTMNSKPQPLKRRRTRKDRVALSRAKTLDWEFLRLSEIAFQEWNSLQDEAAFREL
jgi:hypothetical protein